MEYYQTALINRTTLSNYILVKYKNIIILDHSRASNLLRHLTPLMQAITKYKDNVLFFSAEEKSFPMSSTHFSGFWPLGMYSNHAAYRFGNKIVKHFSGNTFLYKPTLNCFSYQRPSIFMSLDSQLDRSIFRDISNQRLLTFLTSAGHSNDADYFFPIFLKKDIFNTLNLFNKLEKISHHYPIDSKSVSFFKVLCKSTFVPGDKFFRLMHNQKSKKINNTIFRFALYKKLFNFQKMAFQSSRFLFSAFRFLFLRLLRSKVNRRLYWKKVGFLKKYFNILVFRVSKALHSRSFFLFLDRQNASALPFNPFIYHDNKSKKNNVFNYWSFLFKGYPLFENEVSWTPIRQTHGIAKRKSSPKGIWKSQTNTAINTFAGSNVSGKTFSPTVLKRRTLQKGPNEFFTSFKRSKARPSIQRSKPLPFTRRKGGCYRKKNLLSKKVRTFFRLKESPFIKKKIQMWCKSSRKPKVKYSWSAEEEEKPIYRILSLSKSKIKIASTSFFKAAASIFSIKTVTRKKSKKLHSGYAEYAKENTFFKSLSTKENLRLLNLVPSRYVSIIRIAPPKADGEEENVLLTQAVVYHPSLFFVNARSFKVPVKRARIRRGLRRFHRFYRAALYSALPLSTLARKIHSVPFSTYKWSSSCLEKKHGLWIPGVQFEDMSEKKKRSVKSSVKTPISRLPKQLKAETVVIKPTQTMTLKLVLWHVWQTSVSPFFDWVALSTSQESATKIKEARETAKREWRRAFSNLTNPAFRKFKKTKLDKRIKNKHRFSKKKTSKKETKEKTRGERSRGGLRGKISQVAGRPGNALLLPTSDEKKNKAQRYSTISHSKNYSCNSVKTWSQIYNKCEKEKKISQICFTTSLLGNISTPDTALSTSSFASKRFDIKISTTKNYQTALQTRLFCISFQSRKANFIPFWRRLHTNFLSPSLVMTPFSKNGDVALQNIQYCGSSHKSTWAGTWAGAYCKKKLNASQPFYSRSYHSGCANYLYEHTTSHKAKRGSKRTTKYSSTNSPRYKPTPSPQTRKHKSRLQTTSSKVPQANVSKTRGVLRKGVVKPKKKNNACTPNKVHTKTTSYSAQTQNRSPNTGSYTSVSRLKGLVSLLFQKTSASALKPTNLQVLSSQKSKNFSQKFCKTVTKTENDDFRRAFTFTHGRFEFPKKISIYSRKCVGDYSFEEILWCVPRKTKSFRKNQDFQIRFLKKLNADTIKEVAFKVERDRVHQKRYSALLSPFGSSPKETWNVKYQWLEKESKKFKAKIKALQRESKVYRSKKSWRGKNKRFYQSGKIRSKNYKTKKGFQSGGKTSKKTQPALLHNSVSKAKQAPKEYSRPVQANIRRTTEKNQGVWKPRSDAPHKKRNDSRQWSNRHKKPLPKQRLEFVRSKVNSVHAPSR